MFRAPRLLKLLLPLSLAISAPAHAGTFFSLESTSRTVLGILNGFSEAVAEQSVVRAQAGDRQLASLPEAQIPLARLSAPLAEALKKDPVAYSILVKGCEVPEIEPARQADCLDAGIAFLFQFSPTPTELNDASQARHYAGLILTMCTSFRGEDFSTTMLDRNACYSGALRNAQMPALERAVGVCRRPRSVSGAGELIDADPCFEHQLNAFESGIPARAPQSASEERGGHQVALRRHKAIVVLEARAVRSPDASAASYAR